MAISSIHPPGSSRGGAAPSRRDLMGAAGFTLLTGIAAVAIAKPDVPAAEVLPKLQGRYTPLQRLCAQFMALQASVDALNALPGPDDDDSMDRLIEEQASLLKGMEDPKAGSLLEQQARARVLLAWYGVMNRAGSHHAIEWHCIRPLFRDLLGETV